MVYGNSLYSVSVMNRVMSKKAFSGAKKFCVILGVLFMMSGCISSVELAAHGVKTVYNKCSDLDKWNCLWYD
jgi:hypothetical protein